MNKDEKDLLLKDIYCRIHYGLIVQQSAQYIEGQRGYGTADKWQKEPHDFNIIGIEGNNTLITDKIKEERTYYKGIVSSPITICIDDGLTGQSVKPYLRPMSSMTLEERFEYNGLINYVADFSFELMSWKVYDWLNKHHFDYRGLIEKGLALEAPEGMYNLNNR